MQLMHTFFMLFTFSWNIELYFFFCVSVPDKIIIFFLDLCILVFIYYMYSEFRATNLMSVWSMSTTHQLECKTYPVFTGDAYAKCAFIFLTRIWMFQGHRTCKYYRLTNTEWPGFTDGA